MTGLPNADLELERYEGVLSALRQEQRIDEFCRENGYPVGVDHRMRPIYWFPNPAHARGVKQIIGIYMAPISIKE